MDNESSLYQNPAWLSLARDYLDILEELDPERYRLGAASCE